MSINCDGTRDSGRNVCARSWAQDQLQYFMRKNVHDVHRITYSIEKKDSVVKQIQKKHTQKHTQKHTMHPTKWMVICERPHNCWNFPKAATIIQIKIIIIIRRNQRKKKAEKQTKRN